MKDGLGLTSMHEACKQNVKETMFSEMISLGGSITARDSKGQTPLHIIASNGNLSFLRAMISSSQSPKDDLNVKVNPFNRLMAGQLRQHSFTQSCAGTSFGNRCEFGFRGSGLDVE